MKRKMNGIMLTAAVLALAAASAASAGPKDLLPASGGIEGWVIDGDVLTYGPDDLWEYIDGQAESFLMYEFKGVAAAHYLDGDGREIKAEIYEHGSPLMAFGIYSQLRSPSANYFDLGAEAFGDEYSIHFWKGSFYATVSAYDEDEVSSAAMKRFAEAIAGRIGSGAGEPAETKMFPAEGLIEKSVTYITGGALGSSTLPPAFVAKYETEGGEGRLFLFHMESDEQAMEVFESYTAETGAKIGADPPGGPRYRNASGKVPYRGRLYIFQADDYAGVFAGFGEGGQDVRLAGEVVEKIRSKGSSGG